jgi:hypothetical protein
MHSSSPLFVTFPAHFILFCLHILIIFYEEFKLWSPSLCNFRQPLFISSRFDPNILLSTLLLNIFSLRKSTLRMSIRGFIHVYYKPLITFYTETACELNKLQKKILWWFCVLCFGVQPFPILWTFTVLYNKHIAGTSLVRTYRLRPMGGLLFIITLPANIYVYSTDLVNDSYNFHFLRRIQSELKYIEFLTVFMWILRLRS